MAVTYITDSGATYTVRDGRLTRRNGEVNPYLAPELQVSETRRVPFKFLTPPEIDCSMAIQLTGGHWFLTSPLREIVRH